MGEYSEAIKLYSLKNNHTSVEFVFELENEVLVDCELRGNCVTDFGSLPLPIYTLLSDSKASRISFYAPSGDWNGRFWGLQPTNVDNSLINKAGSSHTSIAATTQISNWSTLRARLATLLRMPLNPSRVDINNHPIKLFKKPRSSSNGSVFEPDEETTFGQFFPLQSANADTWKAWRQNLLPCQGKGVIGALLNSHVLHDSMWYAMSLDVSIHRSSSVEPLSSNLCAGNTNNDAEEPNVCIESITSYSTNYLNESEPGVYSVEVKISVTMVVPSTTENTDPNVETTKPDTTYDTVKDKTNILGKIQRASYTWGDTQPVCSVSNTVPTIRYYNTSSSHTYVEVPLARAEITNCADQEALNIFWDKVYLYTSSAINNSPEGTIDSNNNNVRSECTQDVTLRRSIFDSRAMEFKVVTTILPRPTTNVQYTCINTSITTHRFHEPLSDSYTLDLTQYRYTIVSTINGANTSKSHYLEDGLVKNLVGFELVGKDCNVSAIDSFRLDHDAFAAQLCQPTYTFPLSFLPPHTALILTYTAHKRLLSREHQPLDASRGAVVSPAVLYSCSALTGTTCRVQSTKSFIVTSPIPDSSMPYNVITLVSTLLAFFLGSFMNALHKNNKKGKPAANTVKI